MQRLAKIAFFISNEYKNRVSITRIWNRIMNFGTASGYPVPATNHYRTSLAPGNGSSLLLFHSKQHVMSVTHRLLCHMTPCVVYMMLLKASNWTGNTCRILLLLINSTSCQCYFSLDSETGLQALCERCSSSSCCSFSCCCYQIFHPIRIWRIHRSHDQ